MLEDNNTRIEKVKKILLGITISLLIVTNALLFITVYLPRILFNQGGFKLYLLLIFFFVLISGALIVIGISLIGTLRDKH